MRRTTRLRVVCLQLLLAIIAWENKTEIKMPISAAATMHLLLKTLKEVKKCISVHQTSRPSRRKSRRQHDSGPWYSLLVLYSMF